MSSQNVQTPARTLPAPALVARWLVRIAGLVQIVLGTLFWTGNAVTLIPIHTLVGLLLVIGLWTLAFFAARAGVQPGFVIVVVLWGLMLPIFGLSQDRLLTGDAHWVIRVLHLLVGLVAIGQGEGLAARMTQARR
jgi:hypothetical protein